MPTSVHRTFVKVFKVNILKLSGHYMYHQIQHKKTYALPTLYFCVLKVSEQTAIISLYSINWLVFTSVSQMKALSMFYLVIY